MMFLQRIKSDKGGATAIYGLMGVILICMIAIFVVDIVKNVQVKNTYQSATQRAAQVAIKEQNAVGGLKPESANKFITEYMKQRSPSAFGISQPGSIEGYRSKKCNTQKEYPIIKFKYDTTRRTGALDEVNFVSTGGNNIHIAKNVYFNPKYKVIDVEVTDVVDNVFWGYFGKPCQEFTIHSSAIATNTFDEEN